MTSNYIKKKKPYKMDFKQVTPKLVTEINGEKKIVKEQKPKFNITN